MAFGKVQYLRDLRFGHFVGINSAQPHALLMDMKHDARGLFPGTIEEMFQDVDDKLHRRVIVIQQKHTVERRLLGPYARLRGQTEIRPIIIASLSVKPIHRFHKAGWLEESLRPLSHVNDISQDKIHG